MQKSGYVCAVFPFSFFFSVVTSSGLPSNSWKSSKVCESQRFATMGVKVGGVDTARSPTGAWISGSMDQGPVMRSPLLGKTMIEQTVPVKRPFSKLKSLFFFM
ncbi:hypothetical protein CHARACLAT_012759 [Characodon lateralis]|uniref:Secreted protein n=1 Tax=Characodon lateralis TaxID=208331 RepID=A0ABU7EIK6_9TELE|nr:hypothetical protein [Characodon lateralis]